MAGQNPSMVIRVAATIAELKANLAEGKSQIETTTGAMQKLAASFSGDKLIQAAHNVTAAVNQIGGVSKLTDAEMTRVNHTLERALEKYRLLGKEAPAGMQKLADETRGAGSSLDDVLGTAGKLAAVFGVAFSVGWAANFIGGLVTGASEISNLGKASGLTTDLLQALGAKGKDVGLDMATIATAATQLAKRVAGDDTSARAAFGYLGQSWDTLKRLSVDDLLKQTLTSLSGVTDAGLQAHLSNELLGRSGLALLAILRDNKGGFDGVIAAAKEAGLVLGPQSIEVIDKHANAWARLGTAVKVYSGEVLGGLFAAYDELKRREQERIAQQQAGEDVATRWIAGLFSIKLATVDVTTAQAGLNIELPKGVSAADALANRLKQLKDDAMAPLTATQREQIAELNKWGVGEAEIATLVKTTTAAVHLAIEAQRAHATETTKTAAATEDATRKLITAIINLNALKAGHEAISPVVAKSAMEYLRLGASQADVATAFHLSAGAVKTLAKELAAADQVRDVHTNRVLAAIMAEAKALAALKVAGLEAAGVDMTQTTAAETLRLGMERLQATAEAGVSQKAQAKVLTDAYTQSLYDEAVAIDAEFAALRKANEEHAKMPAAVQPAIDSIIAIGTAIQFTVEQAATWNALMAQGLNTGTPGAVANMGSGSGVANQATTSAWVAATLTAARARGDIKDSGGSVRAGQPYYVGTGAQPELFVPSGAGTMFPAGAGGSGATHFHFHGTFIGTNKEELSRLMGEAHMDMLRRSGTRLPVGTF